jgi:hypothetical protein
MNTVRLTMCHLAHTFEFVNRESIHVRWRMLPRVKAASWEIIPLTININYRYKNFSFNIALNIFLLQLWQISVIRNLMNVVWSQIIICHANRWQVKWGNEGGALLIAHTCKILCCSIFMFWFKNTDILTLVRSKFCLLEVTTFPAVANSHMNKGIKWEHDGNIRHEVLFISIGFHTIILEHHVFFFKLLVYPRHELSILWEFDILIPPPPSVEASDCNMLLCGKGTVSFWKQAWNTVFGGWIPENMQFLLKHFRKMLKFVWFSCLHFLMLPISFRYYQWYDGWKVKTFLSL